MDVTDKSQDETHEFSMQPLIGPLEYDGIFVCECKRGLVTVNVSGQSSLTATGANSWFTAVLQ